MDLLAFTRSNSTIDLAQQKTLLKTYTRLLSQVPVGALFYPRGFEYLSEVVQTVLQDLKNPLAAKLQETSYGQGCRNRQKNHRNAD